MYHLIAICHFIVEVQSTVFLNLKLFLYDAILVSASQLYHKFILGVTHVSHETFLFLFQPLLVRGKIYIYEFFEFYWTLLINFLSTHHECYESNTQSIHALYINI